MSLNPRPPLVRHVASGPFVVAIGVFVRFANLALVVRWLVTRTHGSLIPLFGGPLAFAGCALLR
jgi:hypothetical protein